MKEKVTLVVVDFQYDFCLLGAPLYVPGSDKALWNISHLIENNKVGRVIFTADWHPSNHCSFKKNGGQWNEHCVQFSKGAAIHDLLLYGCIGAGIPYEVITKGTLSLSEEYGIKVAPANAKVQYHTIYSSSVGVDVQPDEQVVICGLDKQTEPYRYVILDDDSDMLDCQLPYFIQTDWLKWGLSDEDVEQAIHILNDTAA